jgi:XTP/dITP diphosphohydrolase/tetrapyrrole methylase family protein/MazG family protein
MKAIDNLIQTVAQLRNPDTGCPWDIEQTHQSLADCLIEETCELLQTIDRNDLPHMCEELGDVLLQVVMHAQMAAEKGAFHFDDVATAINSKLIRRHPHVFGDKTGLDKEAVLQQWDAIKAAEKPASAKADKGLRAIPPVLPALLYARSVYKKLQKSGQAESAGVDPSSVNQVLTEAEAGAELFALVARCRHNGIDPESALRRHASALIDTIEPTAPER